MKFLLSFLIFLLVLAASSPIDQIQAESIEVIQLEQAKKLAATHLSLRNIRWGEPVQHKEEEDFYVLFYETPSPELIVSGQRKVKVNKYSGLVNR